MYASRSPLAVAYELKIEKMLSVGQEYRPARCTDVGGSFCLQRGGWGSACGRNTEHPRARFGGKQNGAVRSPGATAGLSRVGQGLYCPSAGINDFQFSFGKKSQTAAVRRPEGICGIVGSGQRLRRR